METTYLLDSDVFIAAKNSYYRFEICPGFWEALLLAHQQGKVMSIDKVEKELLHQNDDLSKWIKGKERELEAFFLDSKAALSAYNDIFIWIDDPSIKFTKEARNTFQEGADGWLIAYSLASSENHVKEFVVVTNERSEPTARRVVKIPDVCDKFGVKCIDTFAMLRKLNIKFVLEEESKLRGARKP